MGSCCKGRIARRVTLRSKNARIFGFSKTFFSESTFCSESPRNKNYSSLLRQVIISTEQIVNNVVKMQETIF